MRKAVGCLGLLLVFVSPAHGLNHELPQSQSLSSRTVSNSALAPSIDHSSSATHPVTQSAPWTQANIYPQRPVARRPNTSARQTKPTIRRNPRATRFVSVGKESTASISGNITSLTSTTDSMISYRQQRHLWESSDGGLHVLINQGGSSANGGLALYSSLDEGATWTLSFSLANTGIPSNALFLPSADGFFKNNKLLLAFSTATGVIKYGVFNYDPVTKQWSTAFSSTIASNTQAFLGSNPTMLADANGIFWCTFVAVNVNTKLYSLQLYRSNNQGQTWSDTGVSFGDTSLSKARSARLITLPNRLGMIYTVDKNYYWAYRFNNDAPSENWQKQLIFQATGDDKDPYASHFSAVSDSSFNVHLTTVSNKKLVYLRYKPQNMTWDTATTFNSFYGVAYTQVITAPNNKLFIALNSGTSGINVLQSEDAGITFYNSYFLSQPDASGLGGVASFDYPRIVAPSTLISNRLPILRQFVLDGIQRLFYYGINTSQ